MNNNPQLVTIEYGGLWYLMTVLINICASYFIFIIISIGL